MKNSQQPKRLLEATQQAVMKYYQHPNQCIMFLWPKFTSKKHAIHWHQLFSFLPQNKYVPFHDPCDHSPSLVILHEPPCTLLEMKKNPRSRKLSQKPLLKAACLQQKYRIPLSQRPLSTLLHLCLSNFAAYVPCIV